MARRRASLLPSCLVWVISVQRKFCSCSKILGMTLEMEDEAIIFPCNMVVSQFRRSHPKCKHHEQKGLRFPLPLASIFSTSSFLLIAATTLPFSLRIITSIPEQWCSVKTTSSIFTHFEGRLLHLYLTGLEFFKQILDYV